MKKTGKIITALALVISVTGVLILWDQNRTFTNDLVGH
jgi:hypothetical protein